MKCLTKLFSSAFFFIFSLFCSLLLSVNNVGAISVNSFGIRSWTYDNGSNWRDLGMSESDSASYIYSGDYFRGFRLVRFANWGDGDYFSGDVQFHITLAFPKNFGFYTVDRIGTAEYNSAVAANTMCSLGPYGSAPVKYDVSDFSAYSNGVSSNDKVEYHGWTVKWRFNGLARQKYSGSYDSYCRLFPSENNSEFFRLGGPNNFGAKIFIEQASTHLAVGASEDQAAAKYNTLISQNQTIIEQNHSMINNQHFGNRQLMDVNDKLNKQTEQQKNQYNEQKNEEKSREDSGKNDSKKLGSLFSFTAFNPFSGLFGLFTGGGCKPIPTIGKMLNKPDASYCPWFPNNVRSILTPVLGISSMMLIFGFFIRWLSGSDLDGTIKLRGK